ncbi:hypothetical protein BH09PSE6_BH09PSE6_27950 [soil metagenome]
MRRQLLKLGALLAVTGAAVMLLTAHPAARAKARPAVAPEARQAAPDPDPDVTTLYRGVIGDDRVQMALAAKPDEIEGFSGHYFIFGGGRNITVAGEIEGENFYMEESEDGHVVSGAWDGKLTVEEGRAVIVGLWRNVDETSTRPFKLERVLRTRTLYRRST